MLSLDFDDLETPEKKIFIGGILCYLYGSESLASYIQQCNSKPEVTDSIRINVLYLAHHRGGNYTYMRGIASRILTKIKEHTELPIIAVTFDARNHGEREIDKLRNSGWKSQNETHGMDMVSSIDGGIQDLKLVINYLGSYLNLESFLCQSLKSNGVKIQFNNILSGYSQGGHTVIRFANRYPENVSIINPNIGCSDLSTLLINRLKGTKTYEKKLFYSSYEELGLNESQKVLYPEAFHEKLSSEDTEIFEDFPFEKVKMFATFYDNDPLVPPAISKLWTDMYLNSNFDSEVYYEEGSIHDITMEMIDKFATWLAKNL